ncbi:ABC transporter ATP-binding protein [Nocardioides baculatus]|uniref:ABC transporter ATP-binding protein n=1 Tax=Nocardioides baculatus TaxID=2801337 RepID=A0ABS1L3T3_9ACTN|nr:ABC transporter ATP-binding protein [Nocardioides baculatus]MBL0746177.1 ABC transporter ATP-binding protein [Nocardioides baculatus]
MLSLDDVTVRYGDTIAVDDVSLDLATGQVLAVLGPSGCGKSTLLRAVAGLEPLDSGTIAWDGIDLAGTPTHRRGFALMFQDGQLFAHLTVARNVAYALRLRRTPSARVATRVRELLALVGLEGYDDRLPGTLSGGERQRVALARALAVEPRLILLDEPLSALDATLRERLAGDLRSILHAAGTTALLVTHDHEEAFALADRLAVMRSGRVVQSGAIDEVWREPVDEETALFLGYARVLRGDAAARVLAAAGLRTAYALALRRSALVVDATGPLRARVVQARVTPEQVRLVVGVDGVGTLDAVAPLGSRVSPGDETGLRVDVTRLAILPITRAS